MGGNYHAIVSQLAAEAHEKHGAIENLTTQGSVHNIQRLAAASEGCRAHFALVQDGLDWPAGLELVARLPRSESVFFLGRRADGIRTLSELRGFRIGIGPEGSGTALLSRQILESAFMKGLGLTLTTHAFDEQFSLLETGALDLGVLVMDEDAAMMENVVRDRGLAILSLPLADVIARRIPRVRTGRIGAGQYDPVQVLPPTDKTVLRVDTLVVGNGCATRSATTGLLTLMAQKWPDFVRRNQETPNTTGLAYAASSGSFFKEGGPDIATEHAPWAVDIMPLSNWIYVITAGSILFNLMGLWSRFRLWRIDARRVKGEERLPMLFGSGITPREIAALTPTPEHRAPAHRAAVADLIDNFEALGALCRQQSVSVVSDMGQELPYRYQEHLIAELLVALRSFRKRVDAQADDGVFGRATA